MYNYLPVLCKTQFIETTVSAKPKAAATTMKAVAAPTFPVNYRSQFFVAV